MPQPHSGEQVLTREIREGLPAGVLAAPAPTVPHLPAPWRARLLRPDGEDELLVRWMAEPHVEKFWQQNWPVERWSRYLRAQIAGSFSRPVLVLRQGILFAYVEIYRPARDVLGQFFPTDPHDLGVHLAIGDRANTGQGLGRELMKLLVAALFVGDAACRLVIAEPDARNLAARRMFGAAGFGPAGEVQLAHKRAAVLVAQRP